MNDGEIGAEPQSSPAGSPGDTGGDQQVEKSASTEASPAVPDKPEAAAKVQEAPYTSSNIEAYCVGDMVFNAEDYMGKDDPDQDAHRARLARHVAGNPMYRSKEGRQPSLQQQYGFGQGYGQPPAHQNPYQQAPPPGQYFQQHHDRSGMTQHAYHRQGPPSGAPYQQGPPPANQHEIMAPPPQQSFTQGDAPPQYQPAQHAAGPGALAAAPQAPGGPPPVAPAPQFGGEGDDGGQTPPPPPPPDAESYQLPPGSYGGQFAAGPAGAQPVGQPFPGMGGGPTAQFAGGMQGGQQYSQMQVDPNAMQGAGQMPMQYAQMPSPAGGMQPYMGMPPSMAQGLPPGGMMGPGGGLQHHMMPGGQMGHMGAPDPNMYMQQPMAGMQQQQQYQQSYTAPSHARPQAASLAGAASPFWNASQQQAAAVEPPKDKTPQGAEVKGQPKIYSQQDRLNLQQQAQQQQLSADAGRPQAPPRQIHGGNYLAPPLTAMGYAPQLTGAMGGQYLGGAPGGAPGMPPSPMGMAQGMYAGSYGQPPMMQATQPHPGMYGAPAGMGGQPGHSFGGTQYYGGGLPPQVAGGNPYQAPQYSGGMPPSQFQQHYIAQPGQPGAVQDHALKASFSKPAQKVVVVNASSAGFDAGNFAKIKIDDVEVEFPKPATERGLHIVILDPKSGHIKNAGIFDTYKSSESLNEFIFKGVPQGDIVVAACKDECTRAMSSTGKYWFSDMGSKEIWKLAYRHSWAFIGCMGNKEATEKRAPTTAESVNVTKILMLDALGPGASAQGGLI